MDEVLEAAELAQDAGLEGAFTWLFRIVGLLLVAGGLGLWLLGDWGLLWVPAVLGVAGLILILVPAVLLTVLEVAG